MSDRGESASPDRSSRRWWSEVRVALGREASTRLSSKGFAIALMFSALVVAAAIAIPASMKSKGISIGIVGNPAATLSTRSVLAATARAAGEKVYFQPLSGTAEGKRMLLSGRLKIMVVASKHPELVVKKQPRSPQTSSSAAFLFQASERLGLVSSLDSAGLSPFQMRAVLAPVPIPVRGLLPSPKAQQNTGRAVSVAGVLATFALLQTAAGWLVTGIVQEKSNRVVEILLSTIRPLQLLIAKVVGIGAVVIGQAALLGVVALVTSAAVGTLSGHGVTVVGVSVAVGWPVVGYAFYSVVFAAAASLVARQEEVQVVLLPMMLPMLVGYATAFAILGGLAGPALTILAWLPPTAPFDMPVLYAMHAVPAWEAAGSALLALASSVLVARFGARVYERAILRTGQRVRLKEILRTQPKGQKI